jgi:cytochrome c oxidase subunit 2
MNLKDITMKKMLAALKNFLAFFVSLFVVWVPAIFAEPAVSAQTEPAANPFGFNMPVGVTPISRDIYYLHMTIFWVCVVIGILVFGVLIYSLIKHRKSTGRVASQFHSSTKVEILWAVIPFIILVVMAIPATVVLSRMEDDTKADVNIKVTGFQWKWKYEYLDQGISFFSNLSTPQDQIDGKAPRGQWYLLEVDKPLVLPIHKKIRFLVTSNDVIHAWWVPAFGIKRDAIPGFIHESWARIEKPGVYRGQCAELCGMRHGFMPIVVIAKTEDDFNKWVAEQKKGETSSATTAETPKTMTKDQLLAEGQTVYSASCSVCHKPDGNGMPPAFPALKGSPITTGPVAAHINIVLNGRPGTAMQAFKDQLTDEQIAAVVTYERNSWENGDSAKHGVHAGGLVQPFDVTNVRSGKMPSDTAASPKTQKEAAKQEAKVVASPASPAPAAAPTPAQPTAQPATEQTPLVPPKHPPQQLGTSKSLTPQELKGQKVYENTCAICHKPDGGGLPPTFPALKGNKIANGPVADHINIVLNGKTGTAMQAFKDQLSDEQIADVITYERNAWGNGDTTKYGKNAGGTVSAEEIAKMKSAKPSAPVTSPQHEGN